jgi:ribulose 1,5-bisphosphate synthetase/thiazole synthase
MIYDVIIVGGGISGTMAAVGAARSGANILIIEKYGFLGGMLTAAGVGPMMTFHAGNEQVIRGTTGELIDRLVTKGKSPGHQFDTTGFTYTVTPFDVEGMKLELENMVAGEGGEILYHTMLAGTEVIDGNIQSITVCNKAGLSKLQAKVFVDATGDADLSTWAGVEYTKGRESDGATQPMTMNMRMMDVDIGKVRAFVKEHPEEFPLLKGDVSIIDRAQRLSIAGFVNILKKAKMQGDFSIQREDILFFEANTPGEVIVNTSRVIGYDANDPWSLSQAEREGRKQSLQLEKFLKKCVPGFENAVLVSTGPQIGIRSSRQIKGFYTLTAEDIIQCKDFPDVIAHSGYPIDIHNPTGAGTEYKKLDWGKFYSIPYRCLVNEKIRNIITVGRCISASFEAQASIRLTPSMGAVGQAGGVAAAMAAKDGISTCKIDVKALQKELIRQGSYI